jgi:hypothetical protein
MGGYENYQGSACTRDGSSDRLREVTEEMHD